MTSITRCFALPRFVLAGFFAVCALALPASVHAQSRIAPATAGRVGVATPSQSGDRLVSVTVAMVATTTDGGTGAGSASAGGAALHLGEVQTAGVFTGAPGSPDLCAYHGAVGSSSGPSESGARHFWQVAARPVAVNGERITLDVDWKRFDTVPGGTPEQHAGDRRTITVVDGGQHVLDFVSAPPETSRCVNALVRIEAGIAVDPALANTTLGYDMWLVDEDGAGHQVTRHMEIGGMHGKPLDFRFLPIGLSANGSPLPDDRRPDISVEVSGTLKGRLLADGSVEVVVTPYRGVRSNRTGGGTRYREQTLVARPGETIRMDIPPSGPEPVRSHRTSLSLTVRVR